MFIRLTRASFDPARYDEVESLFREAMGAIREQPGSREYYAAADRASGAAIAVSTWYGEGRALLDRAALGDVIPRLRAAGVQLEDPEVYEVISRA